MSQSNDQKPDKASGENPPEASATGESKTSPDTLTKLVIGGVVGGFAAAKAVGLLSYAFKAAAPAAAGYLARKLTEQSSDTPAPTAPPADDPPREEARVDPSTNADEKEDEPTGSKREAAEESDGEYFDPFSASNPQAAPLARTPRTTETSPDQEAPSPETEPEMPTLSPEDAELGELGKIETNEESSPVLEPEESDISGEAQPGLEADSSEDALPGTPDDPETGVIEKDAPAGILPSLAPLAPIGMAAAGAAAAISGADGEDTDENNAAESEAETEETGIDENAVSEPAANPFAESIGEAIDEDEIDAGAMPEFGEEDPPALEALTPTTMTEGQSPPLAENAPESIPLSPATETPVTEDSPFPSLTEIEDDTNGTDNPKAEAPESPTESKGKESEKDVFGFLDQNDGDDFVPPPSSEGPGSKDWSTTGFSPASQSSPFLLDDDLDADQEKTDETSVSPLWTNTPGSSDAAGAPPKTPDVPGALPSQFFDLPPSENSPEGAPPQSAVEAFFPNAGPPSEPAPAPPSSQEAAFSPEGSEQPANLATNPWDGLPKPLSAPISDAPLEPAKTDDEEETKSVIPADPSPTFPSITDSPFSEADSESAANELPSNPSSSAFDLPPASIPKAPQEAESEPEKTSALEPAARQSNADFDPIQIFLGSPEGKEASEQSPALPSAQIGVDENTDTKPVYPEPWATTEESTASGEDEIPTPFIPNPRNNPFAKAEDQPANPRGKTPEPNGPSPFLNLDKAAAPSPAAGDPFSKAKQPIQAGIPFPDEKTPITKKRSLLLPITLIGLAAAGAGAGGYFLINAKRSDTHGTESPDPVVNVVTPNTSTNPPPPTPDVPKDPPSAPDVPPVPATEPTPEPPAVTPEPLETPPIDPADPLSAVIPGDPIPDAPNPIDELPGSPTASIPETVMAAEPVGIGEGSGTDTVSPPAGSPEELDAIRIDAEKTIHAFLNAQSIEERMLFSHDVDNLKKDMETYYGQGKAPGPIPTTAVEMKIKGSVPGSRLQTFLYHVSTPSQPQGFPVSVEETTLGFRVDWEAFIQFNDNLLKNFLDDPKSDPGQFYVILRRSHYFGEKNADSSNMISYRVISPIATDTEAFAFVDKRTVIGEYFDQNFIWGRTYRPVLKLKWELDADEKPRVTVDELIRNSWRGN